MKKILILSMIIVATNAGQTCLGVASEIGSAFTAAGHTIENTWDALPKNLQIAVAGAVAAVGITTITAPIILYLKKKQIEKSVSEQFDEQAATLIKALETIDEKSTNASQEVANAIVDAFMIQENAAAREKLANALKDQFSARLFGSDDDITVLTRLNTMIDRTADFTQSVSTINTTATTVKNNLEEEIKKYTPKNGKDVSLVDDVERRQLDTLIDASSSLAIPNVTKLQKSLDTVFGAKDSLLKVRSLQYDLLNRFKAYLAEKDFGLLQQIVNIITTRAVDRIQLKQNTSRELNGILRQAAVLDALTQGELLKEFNAYQANATTPEEINEFKAFINGGGIQGIRNGTTIEQLIPLLQKNPAVRETLFKSVETFWDSPLILKKMNDPESAFLTSYITYDRLVKNAPTELQPIMVEAAIEAIKRDVAVDNTKNINALETVFNSMQSDKISIADQKEVLSAIVNNLKTKNLPTETQKIKDFEQQTLRQQPIEPEIKKGYQPVEPEPIHSTEPLEIKPEIMERIV